MLFRVKAAALLLFALFPFAAQAQTGARVVTTCGTMIGPNYVAGTTSIVTMDPTGVLCTSAGGGGGGGTSSTFGAAFPATGTAAGMSQGGNMVALTGTSGNLNVNIAAGGIVGATSNASSAVATSSTNLPTVSYNYGFNGTTWDQLQVDGSKNLKVNVVTGGGGSQTDASAWTTAVTGFNPIGGVFNDSAAVLTAGQQGTARLTTHRTQLVDTDTTNSALYSAITAAVPCLNATAFNTNSYTTGQTNSANCNLTGNLFVDLSKNLGTAGTANAGVLTIQGIASMTKLLVTPDSVALPANQSVNFNQIAGTATSVNTGSVDAGTQRHTRLCHGGNAHSGGGQRQPCRAEERRWRRHVGPHQQQLGDEELSAPV